MVLLLVKVSTLVLQQWLPFHVLDSRSIKRVHEGAAAATSAASIRATLGSIRDDYKSGFCRSKTGLDLMYRRGRRIEIKIMLKYIMTWQSWSSANDISVPSTNFLYTSERDHGGKIFLQLGAQVV
jgi:hypothetical protein